MPTDAKIIPLTPEHFLRGAPKGALRSAIATLIINARQNDVDALELADRIVESIEPERSKREAMGNEVEFVQLATGEHLITLDSFTTIISTLGAKISEAVAIVEGKG
jgi:hypothetical protein